MKVSSPFKKLRIFDATGNNAHSDVVYATYWGVLYFLNVVDVKT